MLLENTPSVYFQFDDTALKTDRSSAGLFELSCTNQKHIQSFPICIQQPTFVDHQENKEQKLLSKLTTEEFFQQFDNNFVVTFDSQEHTVAQRLSKTGDCSNLIKSLINQHQELQRMTVSGIPTIKRSLSGAETKELRNQGSVLNSENGDKQKNSPIPSFQVKKRTVFKSKANLVQAQNFKITKKKIINQHNLEDFIFHPISIQPQKKNHPNSTLQFYTGKHKSKSHRPQPVSVQTDNTFFNHKGAKESLRSTTLDSWRKRFNQTKKQNQYKNKRMNIFTKPQLLR